MPQTTGRFRTTPQPTVDLSQFWEDKKGTVRRVVAPLDPWVVHFARVVDGYRSTVARVSKWGAPSGGYKFVPKEPPQQAPMHIRRSAAGEDGHRRTFCGALESAVITTTLNNLGSWREKKREICGTCDKRASDGVHAALDNAEAA